MSNNEAALREVLLAARALLEAREDQMITSEEWDALQHAADKADPQPPKADPFDDATD
jgi:hypothetical protein